MNWLLWKEYRLQRLVLAVGLLLLVLPYSALFLTILIEGSPGDARKAAPQFSLVLSVLTLALLGGNAIAGERADRSAEFQAYQPVSRLLLVVSKLAWPLFAAIVIAGSNLFALSFHALFDFDTVFLFGIFAEAGFCAFGVAWLVSSFHDSPTAASASGILAPIALASFLFLLGGLAHVEPKQSLIIFILCATLTGLLSFVAGVWHYLRRVEP